MVVLFVVCFFVDNLDDLMNFLVVVCEGFLLSLFLVLFFRVDERLFGLVLIVFKLLWLDVDVFNCFDVILFLE